MFPIASEYFTPLIFTLSIIAIIYTSLVALMQDDMKKLIAYSSVAHMGYVTLEFLHYKTRHRRKYLSNDQSWVNICSVILMCWSSL